MNLERATKEGKSPVDKKLILPAITAVLTKVSSDKYY